MCSVMAPGEMKRHLFTHLTTLHRASFTSQKIHCHSDVWYIQKTKVIHYFSGITYMRIHIKSGK